MSIEATKVRRYEGTKVPKVDEVPCIIFVFDYQIIQTSTLGFVLNFSFGVHLQH